MIKNKELLKKIEEKKNEISCENCKNCNLGAFHSGKWYCNRISVFNSNIDIKECFTER